MRYIIILGPGGTTLGVQIFHDRHTGIKVLAHFWQVGTIKVPEVVWNKTSLLELHDHTSELEAVHQRGYNPNRQDETSQEKDGDLRKVGRDFEYASLACPTCRSGPEESVCHDQRYL